MSLQLIIGGSGSGKSHRLYKEIIEQSMADPKQNYLILVPEQFTMQTQKDIVALHPSHGIMNIDVLSFQRLAYHVFDEVGGCQRTVLEDTGKSLVIRRLAQQNKEKLKVLGSKLERMGYVGEMKSVLSELAQYDVHQEQLKTAIEQAEGNGMLQDKLHDILVLQNAFGDYKEDKYITSEEILDLLCQVADKSEKLKGSVIALDGFTGFTPVQYQLLYQLLKCADRLMVTVTMDVREYPFTSLREEELFALSKQTIWELRRLAKESGVPEESPVLAGVGEEVSPRFKDAKALDFLERHLLRYDSETYKEEQNNIRLYRGADPEQEVFCAAREIRRLVREEGYRYRDIAVITGDMEGYCHYVLRQFRDSGIPCFIDYKRDILSNPFIEFLRAVFQMMEENFSYDSVFRYLRSGLTGISLENIDRMDNYCVALGLRGYKAYNSIWTRTFQGQDPAELEELNETRESFLLQVKEFKEIYAGSRVTVRERTEGLYRWCLGLDIQQKLRDRELTFAEAGEMSLAKEYAQIYRMVMELFDKVVELMGEEIIPLKEYAGILDAGFEEMKVGIIPPGTDQVVVGDMERTRLKDIRALFFLGVNDGIIPVNKERAGILSQIDRESLKGFQLHLAPDRKENAWIQQFYLYMNLTKPSERLYVSYSARNQKGEVLRPSYLIGMLTALYPKLTISQENPEWEMKDILSHRQGYLKLAEEIGDGRLDSEKTKKLGGYFMEKDLSGKKVDTLIAAAGEINTGTALDRAVAKALYGSELIGSVTRLEKYASCAYAHFLSYGLRLKERQEYTFAALDLGNILHKAMELYTKELGEGEFTWFNIPQEEQIRLMDDCVEAVAREYGNTILLSSSRNAYMIRRMKQLGRKTIWALTEQVRRGKFIPQGFEVSFSAVDHLNSVSYQLKDGSRLKLTGRIDRTDIYENDDEIYVKVIDYKTGTKGFVPEDIYYGLSLQLVVYMNAALEMEQRTHKEKQVIPAAMLYYQMKDPILEVEKAVTEEALQDEFLKELCTKGLVNSDPDVIYLLDEERGTGVPVIPASTLKSGALSARSSVATTQQMNALSFHVHTKIREFGEEITGGTIDISPYQKSDRTACDFCSFRAVCGFDPKRPGYEYRKLKKLSSAQVWEKLKLEQTGGETDGNDMDR